jgi:phosphotransferase system enzyme I (PtsP)
VRDTLPTADEQHRLYRHLPESFAPKPVTIRTLDIGGDEKLPFFTITETSPFMDRAGYASPSITPKFFLTQLRALSGANAGRANLHTAVVHVAGDIVQRAHHQSKPVGVCDEMAGDPASALLPVGLGVDSLGMTPSSLTRVKRITRSITQRLLNHALKAAGLNALVHEN